MDYLPGSQSDLTRFNLKRPRRLTVTIADYVFHKLVQRSIEEGRSLSNLAAYILESVVSDDRRKQSLIPFFGLLIL